MSVRLRLGAGVAGLCLASMALTGCEESAKERLQGTWEGERVENVPDSQYLRAMGWVRGTRLDFKGNRVTITIPAETPRSGRYAIDEQGDDRLLLSFNRPEGGTDEASFTFEGDKRLRWDIGDGREIVLLKAETN